jgi:hypothetical protein
MEFHKVAHSYAGWPCGDFFSRLAAIDLVMTAAPDFTDLKTNILLLVQIETRSTIKGA